MVQRFVPIVQILQHDVLADHALLLAERLHEALLLQFEIDDPGRKQPPDAQTIPLATLEGRSFVEQRIGQDICTSHSDFDGRKESTSASCPFSVVSQAFLRVHILVYAATSSTAGTEPMAANDDALALAGAPLLEADARKLESIVSIVDL